MGLGWREVTGGIFGGWMRGFVGRFCGGLLCIVLCGVGLWAIGGLLSGIRRVVLLFRYTICFTVGLTHVSITHV